MIMFKGGVYERGLHEENDNGKFNQSSQQDASE